VLFHLATVKGYAPKRRMVSTKRFSRMRQPCTSASASQTMMSLSYRSSVRRFQLGQHRTNELVRRRMNFSSDAMADFEGLLEVNRKICKQQMAEKASPTLPTNCAGLPKVRTRPPQCVPLPAPHAPNESSTGRGSSLPLSEAPFAPLSCSSALPAAWPSSAPCSPESDAAAARRTSADGSSRRYIPR